MEQFFSFEITPPDSDRLCPQVSCALEKRTELLSRRKYPQMWERTDQLTSGEKVPQAVHEKRKKRRVFLGFLDWTIGIVLLVTGQMDPQKLLVPLLVGTVCFGAGVAILWRNRRNLLGILSLIKGTVFSMGALLNWAELGILLVLGVVDIIVGLAALLTQKQQGITPFDRAAQRLLQGKEAFRETKDVHVTFSQEGMAIVRENKGNIKRVLPYSGFELVLETEDLVLPVYDNAVAILQKKDLQIGTVSALREFLSKQVQYVQVVVQAPDEQQPQWQEYEA